MSRLSIRSNCKAAVAVPLILALLARVPFADGLLFHDHRDHGVHAHTVTLDDLCEGDLRAAWHLYHDDIHDDVRDDRNNNSDGEEYGDSLLIFVNDLAAAMSVHRLSGTMAASIQHPFSKVSPRSILSSDPTDASCLLTAPWLSAQPLRPAYALDALLQSSHALLL